MKRRFVRLVKFVLKPLLLDKDSFAYHPGVWTERSINPTGYLHKNPPRRISAYGIVAQPPEKEKMWDFFEKIKGLENEKEGGQRCYSCYDIRIGETAKKAKEEGYDFFSTVLSISPMKNVNYINEIGEKYSKEYEIPFLFADFKKKNRYLRSVQISKELNMYRQEYCGCVFSKVEKEQRDKEKLKSNIQL